MDHGLIFEQYFWVVYAASFLASIVSAAVGFIGGTMLLTVMAQFLQMEALIPLHGIIQLSSNGVRSLLLRQYIAWDIARPAMIGSFFDWLPEKLFKTIVTTLIIILAIRLVYVGWMSL